jgi:hypothetical protein
MAFNDRTDIQSVNGSHTKADLEDVAKIHHASERSGRNVTGQRDFPRLRDR